MSNNLEPYLQQSPFTDPGSWACLLDDLPDSVADVCAAVQSLLLHVYEAHLYGVQVPQQQMANVDIEHVSELLTKVVALDEQPLSVARPVEKRLAVCCRQFASLTCAILKHKNVPARTRGGFADYLPPDAYVGHSICEYWQPREQRWIRIDSQIDDIQKSAMHIDFDPLDFPATRFLCGAEAWHAFRSGRIPENRFEGGLANLRNAVALDLLELNCLETHRARTLPSIVVPPTEPPSIAQIDILDCVADQILAGQDSFEAVRTIYEARPEFQLANKPDAGDRDVHRDA